MPVCSWHSRRSRTPLLVVNQIASTLGVHELSGVSIFDAVVGELSRRTRVLVLDSFEHVRDAAT